MRTGVARSRRRQNAPAAVGADPASRGRHEQPTIRSRSSGQTRAASGSEHTRPWRRRPAGHRRPAARPTPSGTQARSARTTRPRRAAEAQHERWRARRGCRADDPAGGAAGRRGPASPRLAAPAGAPAAPAAGAPCRAAGGPPGDGGAPGGARRRVGLGPVRGRRLLAGRASPLGAAGSASAPSGGRRGRGRRVVAIVGGFAAGLPWPARIDRARYSGPCLRGSAYSFGLRVQYVPLAGAVPGRPLPGRVERLLVGPVVARRPDRRLGPTAGAPGAAVPVPDLVPGRPAVAPAAGRPPAAADPAPPGDPPAPAPGAPGAGSPPRRATRSTRHPRCRRPRPPAGSGPGTPRAWRAPGPDRPATGAGRPGGPVGSGPATAGRWAGARSTTSAS